MNYIDLFVLLALGLFALIGYNQGFLKSALNFANFFLALILGLMLYPSVAQSTIEDPQVVQTIVHFSESSEMLGGIENEKISVNETSYEEITGIVEGVNLPHPLSKLVLKNIKNLAFSSEGKVTLGDYLGMTIACMTINILSFLLVFFITYVIIAIAINVIDYVIKLPILKYTDRLAGGIIGFLQGLMILFVVFLAIPLVLAFLPFDEIMTIIDSSSFSMFYYYSNFITNIIKGVI